MGSVSAKTRKKGDFPGSAGSGLLLCLKSHPKRRRELGDRPLQATDVLGPGKPTGQLEGSPWLTSDAWDTLPGSGYYLRVPIPFTGCFSPTQPGVWGLLGPHSALVAFFLCCPSQAYPSPQSGGHPHARVPTEPHSARSLTSRLRLSCACCLTHFKVPHSSQSPPGAPRPAPSSDQGCSFLNWCLGY